MALGIVVGLAAEARVARKLGDTIAIGGGTGEGARDAARQLVRDGATALLSFGLAGGLAPGLCPGTVVVPHAVLVDGHLLPTAPAVSTRFGGQSSHVLLGAKKIAATATEKLLLHRTTGCAALDIESGPVAQVASDAGLSFAVLRAICDPAERDLPPAALVALDASGSIRAAAIARSIALHPAQIPLLLLLMRDAASARRSLTKAAREAASENSSKP